MEQNECILVVDDFPVNVKILSRYLKSLGFCALGSKNGKEAIEVLEKNKDQKIIAILSDLMMPVMDGVDLLKFVKGNPLYKDIPFLAVTALDQKPEFLEKLKQTGLNGFLIKPVSLKKVATLLKELFPDKSITIPEAEDDDDNLI